MAKVNTVLGPISTKDLGFTLAHEHLITAFHGAIKEFPDLFIPASTVTSAVALPVLPS